MIYLMLMNTILLGTLAIRVKLQSRYDTHDISTITSRNAGIRKSPKVSHERRESEQNEDA